MKILDLIETIRKFERNEASGSELYRVCKKTIEEYGAKYVTKLGRSMINAPKNFELRANKVMVVRYWLLYMGKMYKATHDQEFLDFIEEFLYHEDERIREEATKNLQSLQKLTKPD